MEPEDYEELDTYCGLPYISLSCAHSLCRVCVINQANKAEGKCWCNGEGAFKVFSKKTKTDSGWAKKGDLVNKVNSEVEELLKVYEAPARLDREIKAKMEERAENIARLNAILKEEKVKEGKGEGEGGGEGEGVGSSSREVFREGRGEGGGNKRKRGYGDDGQVNNKTFVDILEAIRKGPKIR